MNSKDKKFIKKLEKLKKSIDTEKLRKPIFAEKITRLVIKQKIHVSNYRKLREIIINKQSSSLRNGEIKIRINGRYVESHKVIIVLEKLDINESVDRDIKEYMETRTFRVLRDPSENGNNCNIDRSFYLDDIPELKMRYIIYKDLARDLKNICYGV